jgi:hypothetical protein
MRKIKNVADLMHNAQISTTFIEIIQTSDGFSRHIETYYGLKVVKMTQEGQFF